MTPLDKFWNAIENSLISFVAHHQRTKMMIVGFIGEVMVEVEKRKVAGRSTDKYFELLEEITYKLINIHGFDKFVAAYSQEKGWIKTEIKNTLNFAFMEVS